MFGSVKLETVIIFAPTRGTSIPHQKNDNRALSRSYTTSSPHQCVFVIVGLKKMDCLWKWRVWLILVLLRVIADGGVFGQGSHKRRFIAVKNDVVSRYRRWLCEKIFLEEPRYWFFDNHADLTYSYKDLNVAFVFPTMRSPELFNSLDESDKACTETYYWSQ